MEPLEHGKTCREAAASRADSLGSLTARSSLCSVLWPWPGNGEHHMAFSMVAQPLPVTTINTPRLEGSGHRFGSQEDQGSVDHTPKLPFVALQSSSAGRVGRPVAASKFASSSISRLWRRSISAPSLVLRPYDIPNYKCGTWTKPHSIHIKVRGTGQLFD